MNKLPEKWFIKVEPETRNVLNNWRKTIATSRISNGYFTFNLDGFLYLYSDDIDGDNSYYAYYLVDDYEEITFEQFKKFVLKEDDDNWCIRITEQSLPYINEVRSKNGKGYNYLINNTYVNYYCIWLQNELLINGSSLIKSYKELTLKEFIDKFSLNYLTKKLEDNMEKQVDLLNDEFIVDCKTAEETSHIYDWLIKTRKYSIKTYTDESLIKRNLIVVCNKEAGKSYYSKLIIAKEVFPNHPVYTFNQFKQMYLNPEIKNNNTQKLVISRTELLEIHNIACSTWKSKIKDNYFQRVDLLKDTITFTQEEVDKMFTASTGSQRPVLVRIFGNPVKFKVGDYIICETAKTPKADKIIEITNTHYRVEDCLKDETLAGYNINNQDLRLATKEEIKRVQIKWENIKTGSVVKLKRTDQICNDNDDSFNFNDVFQVVLYKKPFLIDEQNRFISQHLAYNSYCTFYQEDKYLVYSAHNNVDYITEVISY